MIQTAAALRWAWMALVVVTVLSLMVAESSDMSGNLETAIVIAAAALKGRIILVSFMGARSFPAPWRLFFHMWLLGSASVIIAFHLVGG